LRSAAFLSFATSHAQEHYAGNVMGANPVLPSEKGLLNPTSDSTKYFGSIWKFDEFGTAVYVGLHHDEALYFPWVFLQALKM
jgi:hypothetical protein